MRYAKLTGLLLMIIVLLFGAGLWLYQRPLPQLRAEVIAPQTPVSTAIDLPWPSYGQAALGAAGFGVLVTNNTSSPAPIASVAKAITALAILKEKPLKPGDQGPQIVISTDDVQSYNDYLAKDGSVIPVSVGDQISQYQALQAMMLPSANNIADTAARWAFGSVSAYVTYANQFVNSLGMAQTHVADASGFSPQTTSTAKDLVQLAEVVLKNPVLAQIAGQSEASFPGVGTIKNINYLLGADGIVGIKTGNTDEAGGCFLFGAKRQVAGQTVTLIGAILGAPTRDQAMSDSRTLIQAADKGFEAITAINANQAVGIYNLPWGGSAEAVVSNEIKVLNWRGKAVVTAPKLSDLEVPSFQGAVVGSIKAGNSDDAKIVPVVLRQPVAAPSWTWRLIR